MKIVDISLPIDDSAFEVHKLKIERISHKQGIKKFNRLIMSKTFLGRIKYLLGKRLIKEDQLPDKEFLSLEIVHSPVHIGTHIDSPYHYGSHCEGRPSLMSEDIPLELCYQDGVKINVSYKKPLELITASDIEDYLKKINYKLKPLDIVLFYTGCDRLFGTERYFKDYPAVDISAIDYLLDRGIKIFGIDTMGIDPPYRYMLKKYLETKNINLFYPAHFYGRKRKFFHIERLANLERLPPFGFKVICFPVKIRRTGAAWTRVIAILGGE
ncbi:MAG: cyclase family protein [Candidatus Omnitrophica bacterium]|nr:cyclase family protein [Candidatus Omnitrophota bacterium]